ncbi:MAG: hypothetical protein V4695_09560 [Pseudomonadota bacterium]
MTNVTPFAFLRIVVLISLAFRCTASDAVGLGPMRLQSALGQPLRASVQILGADAKALSETCVRSRLTSSDGSEILRPVIELRRPASGATEIFFTSPTSIEEPAVTLLVEIVCAPTLYRDYQLLLDLKDGLPRVLSTGSPEPRASNRNRSSAREPEVANPGGDGSASSSGDAAPAKPKRKRKPRVQPAVANLAPGAGEPDNLQVLEEPASPRPRSKGLPGARNVLKLSQEDVSFGTGPKGPAGLKLSDSLTVTDQPGIRNSEEIVASKARFAAMMRGEDPVLAAQNEVKALQNRLQQVEAQRGVVPPAERPVETPAESAQAAAKPIPPATFRSAPATNKWLIGLAILLLAGIAGISLFVRLAKRGAEKKNTPWWMSSNDASTRETELLLAARSSVEKKAAPTQAPRTVEEAIAHQDKAVESYVDRFVGKNDAEVPSPSRVEPRGFDLAPAYETPKAPTVTPAETASSLRLEAIHDTELMTPSRANLATFELVSDVMQEAEFWKMLNETQRAIDILENYCSTESAASPVPWLYLADLYQGSGDLERLEQLRQQFQLVFNGRFDQESDEAGDDRRSSLEDYPHVIGRISELWGHDDVLGYLQSLLVNDRDAPREGFHLPVYREILLLIEVALEREKSLA